MYALLSLASVNIAMIANHTAQTIEITERKLLTANLTEPVITTYNYISSSVYNASTNIRFYKLTTK